MTIYGAPGASYAYNQGGWPQPNAGFQRGYPSGPAMPFFAGANPNAVSIYAPLNIRGYLPPGGPRMPAYRPAPPRPDNGWIQSLMQQLQQLMAYRPAPPPRTQVIYQTVQTPPTPVTVPLPPPPLPLPVVEPVALAPVALPLPVVEPVAVADPITAPKRYKPTWTGFNIGWQTTTTYTLLSVDEVGQTAQVQYVTTRANTSGLTDYQIQMYDLNNVRTETIPLSQVPVEGNDYAPPPGTILA